MKNSEGQAYRYHHMARLKKVRARYYCSDRSDSAYPINDIKCLTKQAGKVYQTPAMCSCWMCGNPRKYFKEFKIQELKHFEQLDYDLLELAEYSDN